MIYQSNLSFKTNYYDFLIIYFALTLFKIFPFKIKKKIYDYDKLGLNILQELKKQNIRNICFISNRKLGSYLWFYTKIKPVKIQLNKNPKDQFDIWIDSINYKKKYLLINESRIVKDNRFKILKELKYTYEYSTFYLYTIKFYNNALTK